MSLVTKIICIIACHGGPSDHFVTFAQNLKNEGYQVRVYAAELTAKKFQDGHIDVAKTFNPKSANISEIAQEIAEECPVVLTDVGDPFDAQIHQTLAQSAPHILRLAYYDNPESFVPGGYSQTAAKVMVLAHKVLFANANLAQEIIYEDENIPIDLPYKNRVGIGYYPIEEALNIEKRRVQNNSKDRAAFLAKYGVEEKGEKILAYFGGNNEEYFNKAFPAFLTLLTESIKIKDLSNYLLIFQHHPGAKKSNLEHSALEEWLKESASNSNHLRIVISNETANDLLTFIDAALYYQTSMGPKFVLAGIPVIQVGHKTYEDILVRSGLCKSATHSSSFVSAMGSIEPKRVTEENRKVIFQGLGIKKNWFQNLKNSL